MPERIALLPFFFRELPQAKRILVTNLSGAHAVLPSRRALELLVDGNTDHLLPDKCEELFSKNFIAEPAELEVRSSVIASGLATSMARAVSTPGLFMVVPTLRCDHDCRYCQVSRAPLGARGFDADTLKIPQILRHIRAAASEDLKIEFQGGEPLLAFDFIRKFVAEADTALRGKRVSYVICSALGPLTDEMVRWAASRDITFSVSLDGGADVHIRSRPSRYFDSFRNVSEKIQRLRRDIGEQRVACVATVTRGSLDRPSEIVTTYFELGLESMFIRPLSPFGFATRSKMNLSYTAGEYASFFGRLLEAIIEKNQARRFVEESTLFRLRRIYDPGFSGYVDMQSPAGFLLGAMVFNYDGRVFGSDEARMLWETTKAPELVLGMVDDSPERIRLNSCAARLLEDTFTCVMPGCEDCAFQAFCGADPLYHLSTQGDHVGDKSISSFCQLQRALFDQLFELLDTRPDAREVFETWLHR